MGVRRKNIRRSLEGEEVVETKRLVIPAADAIIDQYYAVHDHGFIALVDYMGGDSAIDRAARTSVGGNLKERNEGEQSRLLGRLMKDRHTSPFEMVELKFHCAMPIFVARQWIRHRTANVNEYSGRYSKMPCMFYTPEPQNICHQDQKNKQGRAEQVSDDLAYNFNAVRQETRRRIEFEYEWGLDHDISRELSRIDLPLSTYTQWYWKIDLHNLLHFLKLRLEPAAQFEIRVYAMVMAAMARALAPIAFEHWDNYVLNAVTLSRDAVEAIRLNQPDMKSYFENVQQIVVPFVNELPLRDVATIVAEWDQ
jgi:thymidylate synthase (FAD)